MTRARIDSSPAVAGGRVYRRSNDGRFYALDLSAEVVWQYDDGAALSSHRPGQSWSARLMADYCCFT